jgi:hypothetical protein
VGSGREPGDENQAAQDPWDVPTEPEIAAPPLPSPPPPDEDPFVTLGLMDDLI